MSTKKGILLALLFLVGQVVGLHAQIDTAQEDELQYIQKIADGYRLSKDSGKAELWYAQLVAKSDDPKNKLYYAQALEQNGKKEEADLYYQQYNEAVGGKTEEDQAYLAAAIDRKNAAEHEDILIKHEKELSSKRLDYSPVYYGNGVLFVSTRQPINPDKEADVDQRIQESYMNLFFAPMNLDGSFAKVRDFSEKISTDFHEGPVSFSRDGRRIFFTRNHYNKGKKVRNSKGEIKLQIYTATKEGNEWGNIEELPFNTIEYEEAHPSLSADGRHLYFSSDREGGFGGMDLYVAEFKDGSWGEARNLGATINTDGHEIFPFSADDGTLYFGSNGWQGLGGLDLFYSIPDETGAWSTVVNMGKPINSDKDDFGLILNMMGSEGLFTSSRKGGKGKDDIYSCIIGQGFRKLKLKLCVYENPSEERIKKAQVQLVNAEGTMETYYTDEEGVVLLYLEKNEDYRVLVHKKGYISGEQLISTKEQKNSLMETCVAIEEQTCAILKGTVLNKQTRKGIVGSLVSITNFCSGDRVEVYSDSIGRFELPCFECGCEYHFVAEHADWGSATRSIEAFGSGCEAGKTLGISLELGTTKIVTPTTIVKKDTYSPPISAPTYNGTVLRENTKIRLENIYYDFNSARLRYEAETELDKIVRLMEQYPSMEIELMSHTDARGSDRYNKKLSDRRAKSAVDYIISRGVSSWRLHAQGYGETQLSNACDNETRCSEDEHERNRRTEIKITRLDESDVGY